MKALQVLHPGVQGRVVNSFQQAHGVIGRVVEESYLQMLKHMPTMYARMYEPARRPWSGIRQWVNETFTPAFLPLLESWQPDVIVCTHAFAAGICDVLKVKYGLNRPVLGVITDYVVHPFWLSPAIDMFTLPTTELAAELCRYGVAADRLRVTGIPIDPCFGQATDRSELRAELGLSESDPVLLVMGGGLGMEPVGHILDTLKNVRRPLDVVVLTGKNERLQQRFQQALAQQPPGPVRFHIYGYADNVHEFMQVSDLLVTKPGGLTSAEALAAGLPMLLVKAIPGQEARNAGYLISHKVALDSSRHRHLRDAVDEALGAGRMLQRMKQRARAIGAPEASADIASVLDMVFACSRPERVLQRVPKLAPVDEESFPLSV